MEELIKLFIGATCAYKATGKEIQSFILGPNNGYISILEAYRLHKGIDKTFGGKFTIISIDLTGSKLGEILNEHFR